MKYYQINDEVKNKAISDFVREVSKPGRFKGEFKYKIPRPKCEKKKNVQFSKKAWGKMNAIVQNFSSEIAWHGVVEKTDDFTYKITDIFVYPQAVTGTQVIVDHSKYANWVAGLPEGVYNSFRFQGHSHVNMGVSPSGTDISNQDSIISSLGDDDFYIFMIINKSKTIWIELYDLAANLIYEKNDIDVTYVPDEFESFADECKEYVRKHEPATTSYRVPGMVTNPNLKTENEKPDLLNEDGFDYDDNNYVFTGFKDSDYWNQWRKNRGWYD